MVSKITESRIVRQSSFARSDNSITYAVLPQKDATARNINQQAVPIKLPTFTNKILQIFHDLVSRN